jgi:hypothetical protein
MIIGAPPPGPVGPPARARSNAAFDESMIAVFAESVSRCQSKGIFGPDVFFPSASMKSTC